MNLMEKLLKSRKSFVSVTVLFSLSLLVMLLSPISNVFASESDEVDKMADDMEFIFEEASKEDNGEIIIDKEKISERFGEEAVSSISAFIKMGYGEELTDKDLKDVPKPSDIPTASQSNGDIQLYSWKSCMIDSVLDATGIGFLTGGMMELIDKKQWKKLGKEIIKVAGKNALKGGIVGFAASMAWYSATCIGE